MKRTRGSCARPLTPLPPPLPAADDGGCDTPTPIPAPELCRRGKRAGGRSGGGAHTPASPSRSDRVMTAGGGGALLTE